MTPTDASAPAENELQPDRRRSYMRRVVAIACSLLRGPLFRKEAANA